MDGCCGCGAGGGGVAPGPTGTAKPQALIESYVKVADPDAFAQALASAGKGQQWVLVSPFAPAFRRAEDE